jgi:hypothetical protein
VVPRRLTEAAFRATFTTRMREVTRRGEDAIDIREYVASVPPEDLDGWTLEAGLGQQIWRDAYDRYDHVLLPLSRKGVYLAIVVDLRNRSIHGHHVLDLGAHRRQEPPGG